MALYTSVDDVTAARDQLEAAIAGYTEPAAFALGVATIAPSGAVLDVSYPNPNLGTSRFVAAAVAGVVGYVDSTVTATLTREQLDQIIEILEPAAAALPDDPHPNLEVARALAGMLDLPEPAGGTRVVVAALIGSLDDAPIDTIDVYLRLHLLSHTLVRPNGQSLDGIFGKLNTCVWTNLGPFEVDGFELRRAELKAAGQQVLVHGLDKFPRMTDYVIPPGVRIADANRVRMGAHLSPGTTVMHEGYCNFNAGTLGESMVEGRISAGVIVGVGSDVGGGASIMGTLSGGGTEVISVGENCLIGAEGGIGISLGDNCVVAAGTYITAGTLVTAPDGSVVKALELSGQDNLLFLQNSQTGVTEARVRGDKSSWQGLNADLHKN